MTDSQKHLRFGGDEVSPIAFSEARIAVLPLCYENAVSYGEGGAEGPLHLLEASAQLEAVDEETLIEWNRLGIHTLAPLYPSDDPETSVEQMKSAAAEVLKAEKRLLSLGGDHAISIGPILAAAEIHPGMGVLQIDAHLDLRNTWNGSRFNHACVMRRVAETGTIPFVQVGIRSFSPEEVAFIRQERRRPFFAHEIDPMDDAWMGEVVCALPEKVYLTIDLDGLDPSVIPGTGTPEPGGLTYRQLIRLIQTVGKERRVVAADICELCKIPGTQVSEFTAARIAAKIFTFCWAQTER